MVENFDVHGPRYLSAVNWNRPDDRKTVAACLVKGTSVQERARQKSVAPDSTWWERFGFQAVVPTIIDSKDSSICGTVYQFNSSLLSLTSDGSAPGYVVTFRGTMLKRKTFKQDLKLDLKLIFKGIDNTSRGRVALKTVENLVSTNYGEGKTVWVAGHSLGAAIAMHVGKSIFISQGLKLETFLFNPPYTGVPISSFIPSKKLTSACKIGKACAIATIMEEQPDSTGHKHFDMLKSWMPHMFVNKEDIVCSEYAGYFGHREHMERIGLGDLGRQTAQSSLRHSIGKAFGKDVLPLHLLPSANLYVNKNHDSRDIKFRSHSLSQWWMQDLKLETKQHRF